MRETAEFRIDGKFAPMLFRDDEGTCLGLGDFVRKIHIRVDDKRFHQIGQLQHQLRLSHGKPFFYGWNIDRRYTEKELDQAAWFQLKLLRYFEPSGEQCGTLYDESSACPKCGAGAIQVSDLVLDLRRTPKTADIASTIAGEWIVSQRLAEILLRSGLTGFELRPARHRARYEDDPVDFYKVPTGREILRQAEAAGTPHPNLGFYRLAKQGRESGALEESKGGTCNV